MSFRIFGCRIRLSPLFFILITFLLLIDRTGMMPFVLTAIFIHEAGHLLALCRCGLKPVGVEFLPFEINIEKPAMEGNYRQELAVAAAGVAANLAAAGVAALIYRLHPCVGALSFGAANLVLGVFEALPIDGLDGYRTLTFWGCLRHGPRQRIWLRVLSFVTIGLLAAAGVFVLWNVGNPLPLLFCLYLGVLLPLKENR